MLPLLLWRRLKDETGKTSIINKKTRSLHERKYLEAKMGKNEAKELLSPPKKRKVTAKAKAKPTPARAPKVEPAPSPKDTASSLSQEQQDAFKERLRAKLEGPTKIKNKVLQQEIEAYYGTPLTKQADKFRRNLETKWEKVRRTINELFLSVASRSTFGAWHSANVEHHTQCHARPPAIHKRL